MNFAWRVFRRLAQAFPHEFKLSFGAEVTQLGEDLFPEIARRRGVSGLIRLIVDIAIRVPIEYLSEMRRDMRYAMRALIKSPGFAMVGIISIGLGIGITTMLYNSKWRLITQEVPSATHARRLVMPDKPVSYYYVEQYRNQKKLFTGVTAFQTGIPFNVGFQIDGGAKPERVFGQLVSTDYFSVLGVQPQSGRMLSAELDKPGDAPVVVISDRFWRDRLGQSPRAVGQTLRLNGYPATIVGIAPKDFNGAISLTPAELFVPITVPATLAPELSNDVLHQRKAKEFFAMMCLAPGVTLESAETALDAITRHLDEQDPSNPLRADKSRRVTLIYGGTLVPVPKNLKPVIEGFLAALMGLMMMIVCLNLANMLLSRGANRRRELAIRLAVGASRFRIVRQMMSEGILLSLLGSVAGFGLAYALAVLQSRFMPPVVVPMESNFTPDWQAAVFVFALAILCGVGFSLVPALRVTRTDMTSALKQGSALQLPGYRRFGFRNLLMVIQVAGSLMLLLITGFLVMGISRLNAIQTRFDPHKMYLLSIDPMREGYSPENAKALFEKLPERLKIAGFVNDVSLAAQAPFSIEDEDAAIQLTARSSRVQLSGFEEPVGAGYFTALSEPMLAGQEFGEHDLWSEGDGTKTLPAILNKTASHGFFGNGDPIGQVIRDDKRSYEVIGVVNDLWNGIGMNQSVMYLPLTQRNLAHPPSGGMTIMVRSNMETDAFNGIRREVAVMDPKLTIFNMRTLSEHLERSRSYQRFAIDTYGGIGLFGLVLAAVGLAGVTGYSVAQRRKEIGIRMALGARRGQVLRLVLREGVFLISAGTFIGFSGAFALAKALSALANVFVKALNVGTNDPRLLIGAPLLLAVLALLACYAPARKSTQIDPLKALREE
jgi:macrolide transport system ATP-binding/permease protein